MEKKGIGIDTLFGILQFQTERSIVSLFKNFLMLLEDARTDKKISEEDYIHLRKRILDYGNETVRQTKENFDKITESL